MALARIVLVGLLLALPAAAAAQRNLLVAGDVRVALVIGNAAYKNSPLANPVNDATDIAKTLSQLGFKVILRSNAGSRDMRQAIREFGGELRRAQVGLFYFAGHGVQLKGENYLIPVNADIESEAEVEDLAINANLALRTMEEAQVKVSIVILDACRNNPFTRTFRSSARGLAQMHATTGTVIAFSTAPGSVAADGSGRNGTYTKHLLTSLGQPDSDIAKVFQRARAGVVQETGGKQTPWESTSLIGDFYFRPGAAPAASPAADPVVPARPIAVPELAGKWYLAGSDNTTQYVEIQSGVLTRHSLGGARSAPLDSTTRSARIEHLCETKPAFSVLGAFHVPSQPSRVLSHTFTVSQDGQQIEQTGPSCGSGTENFVYRR